MRVCNTPHGTARLLKINCAGRWAIMAGLEFAALIRTRGNATLKQKKKQKTARKRPYADHETAARQARSKQTMKNTQKRIKIRQIKILLKKTKMARPPGTRVQQPAISAQGGPPKWMWSWFALVVLHEFDTFLFIFLEIIYVMSICRDDHPQAQEPHVQSQCWRGECFLIRSPLPPPKIENA